MAVKKLFIGTLLKDSLTNQRVKIINISVENIDGWETYLQIRRPDGSDIDLSLKSVLYLIRENFLIEHPDNTDAV